MMISPQTILLADIGLVSGALVCLVRLYALQLLPVYPAFSCFLVSQILATLTSSRIGPGTRLYEWVYLILMIAELVIYSFLIKELYNSIFKDFPGIAIVGRWSVFLALFATSCVLVFSVVARYRGATNARITLMNVELVAHTFTFGYAALLITILIAISRYPLRLHRNIFVNTLLFGAVLLSEALGLIAEQLTGGQFTENINLFVTVNEILCFSFWVTLLSSREEKMAYFQLRRSRNAHDERRLLEQLGAINSVLIRAARR